MWLRIFRKLDENFSVEMISDGKYKLLGFFFNCKFLQYQQSLLMRNLRIYNFEHRIEMIHLDKE